MDTNEFRRHGHALIDWIAEYLAHVEQHPVLARVAPGDVRAALPAAPPQHGEPFADVVRDFEQTLVPALTHWNHPGFFAYFPSSASPPGILGELLAAALNQQAMVWRTSPAATELEALTLDWLRQMVGLPSAFEGVIYDTASTSTLHALAAAREQTVAGVREHGLAGRRGIGGVRVYCSEHAHSSVEKAAITLGLGLQSVRRIRADATFALRADALRQAIDEDLAGGLLPCAVVATIGTTSTTSIDPLPAVAALCGERGIWLHVDAAYAGVAASLPDCRPLFTGWELADSIVFNPHKWLFVPVDLSAFFCRRMDVVRQTFALVPDFLQTPEGSAGVHNLMDTGFQLGRRFRALKLWMVLRDLGVEGVRTALTEHIRLARLFAGWVDDDPDFERLAPVPFSLVCFRARPRSLQGDEDAVSSLNERLLAAVNDSGDVFLSHTRLHGRVALRLAIGGHRSEERHVARAWALLKSNLVLMT